MKHNRPIKTVHIGRSFITLYFILFLPFVNADPKSISVCTSPSWIPHSWETSSGSTGILVEIFNDFLLYQGLTPEYITVGSWARCLKQVKQGHIQVVLGAYQTSERTEWGIFSDPLSHDRTRVFYMNPDLDLKDIHDLNWYTGVYRLGSSYGAKIDTHFEIQKQHDAVIQTQTDKSMILLTYKQRADYFAGVESNIYSLFTELKNQRRIDQSAELLMMEDVFSTNSIHAAFSRNFVNSPELADAFNQYFAQHYTAQDLEQLAVKYLDLYLREQ